MALEIEVKINNRKIYRLVAVRKAGTKAKGDNPYRVQLFDQYDKVLQTELIVHTYEDGALKLIQRAAQVICQNSTITRRK